MTARGCINSEKAITVILKIQPQTVLLQPHPKQAESLGLAVQPQNSYRKPSYKYMPLKTGSKNHLPIIDFQRSLKGVSQSCSELARNSDKVPLVSNNLFIQDSWLEPGLVMQQIFHIESWSIQDWRCYLHLENMK